MNIFLLVFLIIWAILIIASAVVGKKAGETDWLAFLCINAVPIVGSLLSIWVYLSAIGRNDGGKE